jgi:hypothetical protein
VAHGACAASGIVCVCARFFRIGGRRVRRAKAWRRSWLGGRAGRVAHIISKEKLKRGECIDRPQSLSSSRVRSAKADQSSLTSCLCKSSVHPASVSYPNMWYQSLGSVILDDVGSSSAAGRLAHSGAQARALSVETARQVPATVGGTARQERAAA